MNSKGNPEPEALDDLDSETIEDLDADATADDVEGGSGTCTTVTTTVATTHPTINQ